VWFLKITVWLLKITVWFLKITVWFLKITMWFLKITRYTFVPKAKIEAEFNFSDRGCLICCFFNQTKISRSLF